MKNKLAKWFAYAVIVCVAYGVARWRKFIVMREFLLKEKRTFVCRTGPGRDVREDWRGALKNRVNPALFVFFRPLALIEDRIRGSRRPLAPTSS